MKKSNQSYLDWYYRHIPLMKKISLLNVVLFSLLLLLMVVQGQYQIFGITMWLWGLSLANLVVQYNQK